MSATEERAIAKYLSLVPKVDEWDDVLDTSDIIEIEVPISLPDLIASAD